MSPNHHFDIDHSSVELELEMPYTAVEHTSHGREDDSGIDCEDVPFELPDKQLCKLIVEQVEQLFADASLIRNTFMAKNLRKNKGGFVNIKLVASYRQVKCICKDWRVISHAIQIGSSTLELNENGTKLRRKQPLDPVDSGSKFNRTVFVINLPDSKKDIDELHRDFSIFGQIGLVRVIAPTGTHPSHTKLLSHIREYVGSLPKDKSIGAIEFNHRSSAENCQKQQYRLIDSDHAWEQANLCIIKNDEESNCKSSKTMNTAIAATKEAEVVLISASSPISQISSSPVTARRNYSTITVLNKDSKTSFAHATSTRIENLTKAGCGPNITRLPCGPDGTRGFKTKLLC